MACIKCDMYNTCVANYYTALNDHLRNHYTHPTLHTEPLLCSEHHHSRQFACVAMSTTDVRDKQHKIANHTLVQNTHELEDTFNIMPVSFNYYMIPRYVICWKFQVL